MYLNCPFCGSADIWLTERTTQGHGDSTTDVFVQCKKCKARGPDTGDYGHSNAVQKEKAIKLWNERPTPVRFSIKDT